MSNHKPTNVELTALDFDVDSMDLPTYRKGERPRSASFPSTFRRRRIIWGIVILSGVFIFFLTPSSLWERSDVLKGLGEAWAPPPAASHSHEEVSLDQINAQLGSVHSGFDKVKQPGSEAAPPDVPNASSAELHQLLHMVSSSELQIPVDADPSQPLGIDVYSVNLAEGVELPPGVEGGGVDVSWLQAGPRDPPVIVFSKTYCPYSKKAKALLAQYNLSPPVKIVEVDLRSDADAIKTVLTRLTNHSTFPNVFIAEKSLGGSDDLERLHESGELTKLLTAAGVDIKGGFADD